MEVVVIYYTNFNYFSVVLYEKLKLESREEVNIHARGGREAAPHRGAAALWCDYGHAE